MHGEGNLRKAIALLGKNDQQDFLILLTLRCVLILTICLYVNLKKLFLSIIIQSFLG